MGGVSTRPGGRRRRCRAGGTSAPYAADASLPYGPFRLGFAPASPIEFEIPSPRASRLHLRFPVRLQLEAPPQSQMKTSFAMPPTLGRAVLLHDLMTLTRENGVQSIVRPTGPITGAGPHRLADRARRNDVLRRVADSYVFNRLGNCSFFSCTGTDTDHSYRFQFSRLCPKMS